MQTAAADTDYNSNGTDHRYLAPGWFTRKVFNRAVVLLNRMGISVWGSRAELRVRGRKTGEWRTNAVNLLTHDDRRYLVAPRGRTQWVRNLQAAGTGELRVGRRVEEFAASKSPTPTRSTSCARTCGAGRWRSACSSTAWAPTPPTRSSPRSLPATRCSSSRPSELWAVQPVGPKRSTRTWCTGTPRSTRRWLAASAKFADPHT